MKPEIRTRPLARSRLARDYQAGAAGIRPFYNGNPRSLDAFRRKVAELGHRFDHTARRAMAEAIRPTSPAAEARLQRVVDDGGFLVTTGQQAGLFGGPLYTIYKALTAVRLAETLESALNVPVAPLFWVASEDHDWAEVNHAFALDARDSLRRLELHGADGVPAASMARRLVGADGPDVVERLGRILLPPTDHTAALLAELGEAYRPERSMAGAFSDLLASWLAPFDLLLVDAADPHLKDLSVPILADALRRAGDAEAAVVAQTRRLTDAGYEAPVALIESAANVFYEDDTGRDRLIRNGTGWGVRSGPKTWSQDELLAELEATPGRFSPNVLLRPVIESAVFPTLAYVAGPSELAYFGQLACLFELHGVGMPLVQPRGSAVLIEPHVRETLDRFHLDVDDLEAPAHEIISRIVRARLPADVARRLDEAHEAIETGYERLSDAAEALDPTLAGSAARARRASLNELDHFERKVLRRLKARDDAALRRLQGARSSLFPDGQPQERVLAPVGFLARWGKDLLGELAHAFGTPPLDEADWGPARCT